MLRKRQKERTKLELEVDALTTKMGLYEPFSKEYTMMAKNLEVLHRIKDGARPNRVSPDTVAIICGNITGILILRNWEELAVLPKALGFVIRGRV